MSAVRYSWEIELIEFAPEAEKLKDDSELCFHVNFRARGISLVA